MFIYLLMCLTLAEDRDVQYDKVIEIDFEELDISGKLVKPQGTLVVEASRATFNPMIPLRVNFNPEIANSVNDIK